MPASTVRLVDPKTASLAAADGSDYLAHIRGTIGLTPPIVAPSGWASAAYGGALRLTLRADPGDVRRETTFIGHASVKRKSLALGVQRRCGRMS